MERFMERGATPRGARLRSIDLIRGSYLATGLDHLSCFRMVAKEVRGYKPKVPRSAEQ